MTQKEALKMRAAINALFALTKPDRYCVAIEERRSESESYEADYGVYLYLREPNKSGFIELALLARTIEDLGTHFLSLDTTYDAGTKKNSDVRKSVMIW